MSTEKGRDQDRGKATEHAKAEYESTWYVYIVECSDNTLYTGITTDVARRIDEHNDNTNKSKGAKYTRTRQPVTLAYSESSGSRSSASSREFAIKKLTRAKKNQLIASAKNRD